MVASHRCLGFGAWFCSGSWTLVFGAATPHGSTQNSEELGDDCLAERVAYYNNEPAFSCSSAVPLSGASDDFAGPGSSLPSGGTLARQLLAEPDSRNRARR